MNDGTTQYNISNITQFLEAANGNPKVTIPALM